jgi:hypothetical protein
MPRLYDVTLVSISCEKNGFGGPILVTGDVSGRTYMRDPRDPPIHQNPVDTKEIYPFLGGPVSVAVGKPASIQMDESVTFTLLNPFTDRPGSGPSFLMITANLDRIGLNAFIIDKDTPPEQENVDTPVSLTISAPNVTITLHFILRLQPIF